MKQADLEFVRIENDKYEEMRCKKCPRSGERKYCMILETRWWMPMTDSVCKDVWFTPWETLCRLIDVDDPGLDKQF